MFKKKNLLLLLNAIPFIQFLVLIFIFVCPLSIIYKIEFILTWIYLLPPLLAQISRKIMPITKNKIDLYSREYFSWWFQFNLQVIYIRLPFIEELIRIVPGLYSIWLRLWGSKIGKLIYWAPGLRVLDRSYLNIGDNVMFGADVRLNPHVILKEGDANILLLEEIVIKKNVFIGGYSLLTSGIVIEEGESLKSFSLLTPFCSWKNGKRVKPESEK